MTVTWNDTPGAEGYLISVGGSPGQYNYGTVDLNASAVLGPVDIGLLGQGKTYYLAVSAYSALGVSRKSDEIAVKLPPLQAGSFSTAAIVRLLMDDFPGRLSGIPLGTFIRLVPFIGIEPVMTFASIRRPELYSRIPGGILIDYGTSFKGKDGLVHSGSLTVSLSNYSHSWGRMRSGFSGVANDIAIDGRYLADGSSFGTITAVSKGSEAVADISFEGVFTTSPDRCTCMQTHHLIRPYALISLSQAKWRPSKTT